MATEMTRETFKCQHCPSSFTVGSNLRKHLKELHNAKTSPILCIDSINGIYITPKFSEGPIIPIHVVKSTQIPIIACEVDTCEQVMRMGASSGNPGKECESVAIFQTSSPASGFINGYQSKVCDV